MEPKVTFITIVPMLDVVVFFWSQLVILRKFYRCKDLLNSYFFVGDVMQEIFVHTNCSSLRNKAVAKSKSN